MSATVRMSSCTGKSFADVAAAAFVGCPPEAPLSEVAAGDFAGLEEPYLVAAACQEQFETFIFSEGLVCSEVRRLIGDRRRFAEMPDEKILLLLSGWHTSPATAALVEWWVNDLDRYTVDLPGPLAPEARRWRVLAWLALVTMTAAAAVLGWMVMR